MKTKSRLEEISKKRYQRNIFLIFTGIVLILVVFFFYGVPMIINLSLFIVNIRGNNDTGNVTKTASFLAPPVLNPVPDATNSARITIGGTSLSGQMVILYLNNKYIDQTAVTGKNNFVFDKILLDVGVNDIKAKTISSGNKESDYSQNIHIVYKNKPPALSINSPADKQIISNGSNQIKVEGKTDVDVRVTVNGFWAIVDNLGNYSYILNLPNGEHKIKVIANDNAGNQETMEISVILNQ